MSSKPPGIPGWFRTNTDAAIHYTYDADGNLASYCDAGGTVTYTYNTLDQLTGLADPGGSCAPGNVIQPCTTYTYDADGHAATTTWPTTTDSMQCDGYDNAGNLRNLVAVHGTCTIGTAGTISHTGTVLSSLTYTYTTSAAPTADTGLNQSVTNNVAGLTTTYTYNSQAQLHSATDSGADTNSWVYTYDPDGNMLTKTVNGGTPTSYSYNADDEQKIGGSYNGYNGAGDQTTTLGSLGLTYNTLDQTTQIQSGSATENLSYLGTGQQGLSVDGTATLQTSKLGVTATTSGGPTRYYSRTPGGSLATLRTSTNNYYYILDANGSVIGLIDPSGTLAATYTYDPYGTLTGSAPTVIAAGNPFRYDSGYQDASGLYHFGARYYDPAADRWTQLDPSGRSVGYVFSDDDPINDSDFTGEGVNNFLVACALSLGAAFCSFFNEGAVASPETFIENIVQLDEEQLYYDEQALEAFYNVASDVAEDVESDITSDIDSIESLLP